MLFTLQRYEFFSKSQLFHSSAKTASDVVYPTKVRIFQQITTVTVFDIIRIMMLFTLQRYEFFSKSQREPAKENLWNRCCLPYKGTNFSANHNVRSVRFLHAGDVVYPTKVRIFQQITTDTLFFTFAFWCCLPYKGTNFSANHNVSTLQEVAC